MSAFAVIIPLSATAPERFNVTCYGVQMPFRNAIAIKKGIRLPATNNQA
jgi:hypothetical protein